jgi:ABC-type spermidine/putrescine transport system permease subunit II
MTIAGWLIVLIGIVLLLVALYAFMTYPHLQDIDGTVAAGSEFDSYREYQAAWFTQVKDLLQLLVVSLLVPLLATVIGYIFGRQVEQQTE